MELGRLAQIGRGMAEQGKDTDKEKAAKLKIRNGVRLILLGLEELWDLPRSFPTKTEQGRR